MYKNRQWQKKDLLANRRYDAYNRFYIMKQEIAALKLIASPELLVKLDELQNLSEDHYNDFQNCLSKISPKDANSFKPLETIGKDARWQRFSSLYEEITILMKKEIQIK